MSVTMFWLQCGSCGGDTWSLFNSQTPNVKELFEILDIELLWHPSISCQPSGQLEKTCDQLLDSSRSLDILCVEGSVICGPDDSGMFDTMFGRPKKDLVAALAAKAKSIRRGASGSDIC